MNEQQTEDRFLPDRRIRFLIAILWLVGLVFMKHPLSICLAGLLPVAVAITCGTGKRFLNRLMILFPFLILSAVTLLFSDGWPITADALNDALLLLARLTVSLLVFIVLFSGDIHKNLAGLKALKVPDSIISILFLSERYLNLLGRQFSALFRSLASRLFRPGVRTGTLKVYGQIIGGLTVRAVDRSDQIRKAMESRGFQATIPTPCCDSLHGTDFLKGFISLMILAAIVSFDFWLYQ